VVDLRRRVALEVHIRQRGLERADRLDVEVEADMRVLAVHHVDLGEAGQAVLLDRVGHELLGGDRVGVFLLPRRRERAELALHAADVRLVEIEVLDEVDLVRAVPPPARRVRELAELEEVVRLHEDEPVLEVEALVLLDLLPDRIERTLSGGDGHPHPSLSTTICVSVSREARSGRPSRAARALAA
jgi:hypothetical protein